MSVTPANPTLTMRLAVLSMTLLLLALFICPSACADIRIVDDRGEQIFDSPPERVAVLNWDLLEQVLALDVVPVAATEIEGYADWVVQPAVPEGVIDLGTRAEPNLERLSDIGADVILAAGPQADLVESLETIAPVVLLSNHSASVDAAQVAMAQLRQLGVLFGREAMAEERLSAMQQRFDELAGELSAAYGESMPSVLLTRFASETATFVYTEKSTADYVLQRLGLGNALPLPPAEWGVTQRRIESLQTLEDAYVLYLLPFTEVEKLDASFLWQAMPFVRKGHVSPVDAVWSYGGAMSLQYLAEAVTRSLLDLAP